MIPPPPPQPLDDIVYTPGTELCVQRPNAWTDQDVHTQERAAATCLLCPLLDACRAAIDGMEPVWGTQDTIWAGETPGQRKRRRATGGTGYGYSEAGTDQARSDARVALVEWHAHEDPEMGGWPEIRPEIAAALGIEL